MRTWVWSLTSLSGSGYHVAVSCGVGRRRVSGLVLLWLGCRPSAVAPIRPLWEAPYAEGVALLKKTKKKKRKKKCVRDYLPSEQQSCDLRLTDAKSFLIFLMTRNWGQFYCTSYFWNTCLVYFPHFIPVVKKWIILLYSLWVLH